MAEISQRDFEPLSGGSPLRRLIARFADWRNQKVMDPQFQAWAMRFWLTRPLVRKRQKELFDLTAGFVYSQVLFSCVSLGVFEHLKRGAISLRALSARIGLDEDQTTRLIDAAAALKLLRRDEDGVRLADLGAALIANPGIVAMIRHHAMLYRDLSDPVALLRGVPETTELSTFWGYATSDEPGALGSERVDDYSALMAISQAMVAREVVAAYPFEQHRLLLDVGGGEGAFAAAVGSRFPDIALSTFDLPAVAARATAKMADAGLADRFTAHGGSFFDDPLPRGADLVSLVRVLYDHDDEKVMTILRAVRDVLPYDGTLLVAEPMAETPGAETMGAYFGFYLIAMQSGRSRSRAEICRLLEAAGFSKVKAIATRSPLLTSVITANV